MVRVLALIAALPLMAAAPRARLIPEFSAPVAEAVLWSGSSESAGTTWYRFRVRAPGADFSTIRDFGPDSQLLWTASAQEGIYELELTALTRESGEASTTTTLFEITPRVTVGDPVVSSLNHPLVFLYSAPACPEGSTMRVSFQNDAGGSATVTPPQDCNGRTSMNFYLAGLRANSGYSAHHSLQSAEAAVNGPAVSFSTSDAGIQVAANTVDRPAPTGDPFGVILQSAISQPGTATDLEGNLIWYYEGSLSFLTRPEARGRFMGILEDLRATPDQQVFRLFDLAGFTLKETNAARVTEQLLARGHRGITAFHHEARLLPDGTFLVLASTEQLMTGVQGEGEVDVLGDMILVLDSELQVQWVWDAFDHLDVRRKATLGEVCEPQGGGCPPFYLAPVANDWLHGNSLQFTPDGNILFSLRHQDWLIKIDYDYGQGSGAVLWRLGKDGDFQAVSPDPSPWFSHQHDGAFTGENGSLTVFDNSNLRAEADSSSHSRGQMWIIDEAARTATLALNADLGVYSFALGSASKFAEGRFHFDLGWVPGTPVSARSVEVDREGTIRFSADSATALYRTFRMKDLYTAPSY